jgi:hypothetical protein
MPAQQNDPNLTTRHTKALFSSQKFYKIFQIPHHI